MNVPKKKEVTHKPVLQVRYGICVHMNKKNRCTFEDSKHYSQRCKEAGCVYFKRK